VNACDLSPTERLRLHQDLDTLEHVEKQLADLDGELARLSNQPPWNLAMPFLIQLPGLALLSAMTVLAAIGDITRFPTASNGESSFAPTPGRLCVSSQMIMLPEPNCSIK